MIVISDCPACQGQLQFAFEVSGDDFKMKVYRCRNCRSYVKSPFFDSEELQQVYAQYDFHEYHYDPTPGELSNISSRLVRLEQMISKGKLLEIGCGRGFFLREALARGWDAQAMEFGSNVEGHLLDGLATKVRTISSEMDFETLLPESFDVICSYQVFEHLTQPARALAAWNRALRPGGILVIQTPHALSMGARLHGARWLCHLRKEHFVIYSRDALKRLYRENGIHTTRIFYGGAIFLFTGKQNKTIARKISMMDLYAFKPLTQWVRSFVYGLGLGDSIEIYGQKQSENQAK